MAGSGAVIDDRVKDEIRRFPTVELIRRLFPSVQMRGRSRLCNPLREDRNPSLSCFRDSSGYPAWKDHGTGESGDNIAFFRKAFPELSYPEAVDRLSWMLLGRSAFSERGVARPAQRSKPVVSVTVHAPVKEVESALRIVSEEPLSPVSASPLLVSYWRGRGISDAVALAFARRVVFENVNRVGRVLRDDRSGLPVFGGDGEPLRDDGLNEAVAMRNDIGGFSLRVPEGPVRGGFKGCDASFITTVLSDGSQPFRRVVFAGRGDGRVSGLSYDGASRFLYVSPVQGFSGVEPWAARFAVPFLRRWEGRYLEGRDLRGAVAVLDALNGPVSPVVTVVEGLFDALSLVEMQRMSGRGVTPGTDIVVLNSVSNISWAVPFLSMHAEVRSLLDNDLSSGAGQKAFALMRDQVAAHAAACGGQCFVRSDSGYIAPDKDVNDYLRRRKGLLDRGPVAGAEDVKKNFASPAPVVCRPREPRKPKGVKL